MTVNGKTDRKSKVKGRYTLIEELRRDVRFRSTSHTIRKTDYEVYNKDLLITEVIRLLKRLDIPVTTDTDVTGYSMVIQYKKNPSTATYKLQIFEPCKYRKGHSEIVIEERAVMEIRSLIKGVLIK